MNVVLSSYVYWCIGLVVLTPILIVVLNEGIDRSRRGNGKYADLLLMIRDILLPLLVLIVMLRFVFSVSEDNLPTKLLSSAFWLALMVAVFQLMRKMIGSGSYSAEDWRNMVPHMFLRLPPYTIMGLILFHVIQNLWSLPIREMATTLGIGSIVIAFALQDTLSNLVSGILLVANSPFKPGDWVHVGSVEGRINAVNWRYTNIETWSGDLVVIPNGSIAGESIENHSRPTKQTALTQTFTVSYEHTPNSVKAMFDEVFNNTPGILKSPEPSVVVTRIDDPAMEYTAEFWIDNYGAKSDIHAEFMSRVWYAIHRHNIDMPTTEYHIHNFNGHRQNAKEQALLAARRQCLEWLPQFSQLPQNTLDTLANAASLKLYSMHETIVNQNETETGVCLIASGSVTLSRQVWDAPPKELQILHTGEFFGEAGLFGRGISQVTAIAAENTEILCVPHELINDAINRNTQFANDISAIIEQRRNLIEHLTGAATKRLPENTTVQSKEPAVTEI